MWTPPPEPDRPNCPYLPGFEVQLTEHVPPAPFGGRWYGSQPEKPHDVTQLWLESHTQTELVVAHPPLETSFMPGARTAHLRIVRSIAIGNARGAQLAYCHAKICGTPQSFFATAKIYDALYYPYCHYLVSIPLDVVTQADRDYRRETAAFLHLSKLRQTSEKSDLITRELDFAPEYFGSWTFSLSITVDGAVRQRPVRLMLMEHLDGCTLINLYAKNSPNPSAHPTAFHLEEKFRLAILARVMIGGLNRYGKGYSSGIWHPPTS